MAKVGAHWSSSPLDYGVAVKAKVRDMTRESALTVFNYCVSHSPIDSGAYRASWFISEGSPEYKWVGRQRKGDTPLPPPETPRLSTLFYRTFYVTNGAPYALRLEHGWSDQAPLGVVRQALKLIK